MKEAIDKARETMMKDMGGPFGAMILDKDGNVLSVSSNTTLGDHDPTAHAEINAIREACRKLRTHDLTDCVIYATGYPCPMCLAAIMWANIKEIYYGTTLKEAEDIGFRDDFIYDYIKTGKGDLMIKQKDHLECLELFREYHDNDKEIY